MPEGAVDGRDVGMLQARLGLDLAFEAADVGGGCRPRKRQCFQRLDTPGDAMLHLEDGVHAAGGDRFDDAIVRDDVTRADRHRAPQRTAISAPSEYPAAAAAALTAARKAALPSNRFFGSFSSAFITSASRAGGTVRLIEL